MQKRRIEKHSFWFRLLTRLHDGAETVRTFRTGDQFAAIDYNCSGQNHTRLDTKRQVVSSVFCTYVLLRAKTTPFMLFSKLREPA